MRPNVKDGLVLWKMGVAYRLGRRGGRRVEGRGSEVEAEDGVKGGLTLGRHVEGRTG